MMLNLPETFHKNLFLIILAKEGNLANSCQGEGISPFVHFESSCTHIEHSRSKRMGEIWV